MTIVVDASVAFKWFVADEPHAAAAVAVLRRENRLLAPDLIISEVCNTAWRAVRSGRIGMEQALLIAERLPRLCERSVNSGSLAPRAIEIARELDHPVHDCFYIALAEARQVSLVTADGRLLQKLKGTRWEAGTLALADYPPAA